MTKSIVISVPHHLTLAEARRRIAAEIDFLRSAYVEKFAHSEVTWTGDSADIRVVALAQEAKAHIDVTADNVRIEVVLPWLLARLAGPLEQRLAATTRERLALQDRRS
ncbi:MAG TPA: polyhydroxyalkanoic acid system family protein [Methylovirgula sp.]|nr:polyhydroxyalkanoic acid system family protein [Methylovirgula sp.]